MTQVFLLNVFYDLEIKLFSFHLLVMAVFLLLPDVPRLVSLLVFNRATATVERLKLFPWKRCARVAPVMPVAFAVVALEVTYSHERAVQLSLDPHRPGAAPFEGIWDVDEFTVDGHLHPPLTTDEMRWQKVVFDDGFASIQRMSGFSIWTITRTDPTRQTISFDYTGKPDPPREMRQRVS